MSDDRVKCGIYLAIDMDGDFGAGDSAETALEDYRETYENTIPVRVIKLNIDMPEPKNLATEIDVTLDEQSTEPSEVTVQVA